MKVNHCNLIIIFRGITINYSDILKIIQILKSSNVILINSYCKRHIIAQEYYEMLVIYERFLFENDVSTETCIEFEKLKSV